jgi:hypothetical protein
MGINWASSLEVAAALDFLVLDGRCSWARRPCRKIALPPGSVRFDGMPGTSSDISLITSRPTLISPVRRSGSGMRRALPEMREASRWRRLGAGILLEQIERQTCPMACISSSPPVINGTLSRLPAFPHPGREER